MKICFSICCYVRRMIFFEVFVHSMIQATNSMTHITDFQLLCLFNCSLVLNFAQALGISQFRLCFSIIILIHYQKVTKTNCKIQMMIKVFRQVTNKIFYRKVQLFGSIVNSNVSYPYKFNGLQKTPQTNIPPYFFKKLFGENVQQGFKQAYVSILQALRDSDKQFLAGTLQKSLVQNMKFAKVNLVNENSPIQIRLSNLFLVFGGEFTRTALNRKVINMSSLVGGKQTKNYSILMAPNLMKDMKLNKINVLFGCEAYFKSAIKLIKSDATPNSQPQIHMLQFEINNAAFSIMQLMPLMSKFSTVSQSDIHKSQDNMTSAIKLLIGNNYEWKIGDVDKVLNGNFQIVSKERLF